MNLQLAVTRASSVPIPLQVVPLLEVNLDLSAAMAECTGGPQPMAETDLFHVTA